MATDTEIIDWLEARGRVKARVFGASVDMFEWSCKGDDGKSLREAVVARMEWEAENGILPPGPLLPCESRSGHLIWRRGVRSA